MVIYEEICPNNKGDAPVTAITKYKNTTHNTCSHFLSQLSTMLQIT